MVTQKHMYWYARNVIQEVGLKGSGLSMIHIPTHHMKYEELNKYSI